MKNIKWLSLVVLALGAVACDPYDDAKSGTPNLLSVTAADFGGGAGFSTTGDTDSVSADGTATLDITCADICEAFHVDPADGADSDDPSDFTDLTELAIFVTFDRQFDGDAVQSTLSNCSPTGGWLTVTPTAAAGEGWYSCYSPSSGSPDEGGSVVVFNGGAPVGEDSTIAGWDEFEPLAAAPAPIVLTGTVAGRTLNVTVNRVDTATCGVCPAVE
jgi:hypothetical protein